MNMKVMRVEESEDSIREAYFQWRENMEPYGFNGIDAFTAGVAWALSQQEDSSAIPPAQDEHLSCGRLERRAR